VEIADVDGMVTIQHSAPDRGDALQFTLEEFRAFVAGVKAGEFDDLCA
jgi:hypothetical protein